MPELQKGAELTLAVTDLNNLGCGVAHAPDGRVVFLNGAVAGDTVRALIIKVNQTFAVGKVLEVVSPSSDRADGYCAVPASCGGCVYRNLTYEKELELKRSFVEHAFRKAGIPYAVVEPVRTAGEIKGYRNKAEYPITGGKNGLFGGFYAQKTHRVIPAFDCSLQPREFGEILHTFCDFYTQMGISAYDEETGKGLIRHLYLRRGAGTGDLMACPVINGKELPHAAAFVEVLLQKHPYVTSVLVNENTRRTNVVLGERYHTLYGQPYIEDVLCGKRFRIAPASFYQVNHDAAELLYTLAAERTELNGTGLLLDLYCGSGTIGLSMAQRAGEVIGIEIVPAAVECANINKALNGIKNASFYCGDAANAEGLLAPVERERGALHPDVVILDPPRKGCDAQLLDFLAERRVPRIVYVSCGPDTLARDCAILAKHGYDIGVVTPVDLFPRTGHVESVCLLSKLNTKQHIEINLDMDELDLTDAEKKATYQEIKDYVLKHSGLKVSSLYIAQVKQTCGIIERENYNKPKSEDAKQPQCPPDKEKAIKDALKHFGMI
ncbi:MAG: 23S rRNA (uracil(1939)-C(5))-methyltransferase RlmD [Clostridia bacterium]|nr:23S rRNA (uracil(1939)-C(5))-methyltransferase RlmD [Clostridia bacterium]